MNNIASIILIVISAGVFFVNIDPQYKEVQALRVEQTKFNEALDNTDRIKTIKENLDSKLSSFDPIELEKLNKLIPVNVDLVDFAAQINNIAASHGILIKDVKASNSPAQVNTVIGDNTGKVHTNTNITIRFQAPYTSFLSFVESIEKNLRLADISSVTFNSNNNKINLYDYTLSLQIYSLEK